MIKKNSYKQNDELYSVSPRVKKYVTLLFMKVKIRLIFYDDKKLESDHFMKNYLKMVAIYWKNLKRFGSKFKSLITSSQLKTI